MKTLYIECGMGAAGDMLTAALLELMPDPDAYIDRLNSLGIPDVKFTREKSVKCGITGTHISVTVNGMEEGSEMHDHEHSHEHSHEHEHDHDAEHEHHHEHGYEEEHEHHHEHDHDGEHTHHHSHNSMDGIRHIVCDHMYLPAKVREDVLSVYSLIADAESHVHGVPIENIHFHEVGTMDAVADITAVCMLMNEIAPDEVVVSPVHVGSGQVKCAHGILPVPAPATALILQGIPIYGGGVKGELCTPTGAALLKHFATRFGDMPVMTVNSVGYGMGRKDFQTANCVRVMLGESTDQTETVVELSCNVDDMTAEDISFAVERLFDGGAFEVYTVPIGMKKSRPGTLIRVMCSPQKVEEMVRLIYKYTSTIGVRQTLTKRFILDRKIETVSTGLGDVRVKKSSGYGTTRQKYEFEDLSRIAREKGLSLAEVRKMIEDAK
jgi:hypothetical protein